MIKLPLPSFAPSVIISQNVKKKYLSHNTYCCFPLSKFKLYSWWSYFSKIFFDKKSRLDKNKKVKNILPSLCGMRLWPEEVLLYWANVLSWPHHLSCSFEAEIAPLEDGAFPLKKTKKRSCIKIIDQKIPYKKLHSAVHGK